MHVIPKQDSFHLQAGSEQYKFLNVQHGHVRAGIVKGSYINSSEAAFVPHCERTPQMSSILHDKGQRLTRPTLSLFLINGISPE